MGNLIEKWFDFILKLQEKIFTNKTVIKIAKKQIEIVTPSLAIVLNISLYPLFLT